ncbi:hypothetical protein BV349_04632 [Pseudomonas syringae pv. actinidiae]|uniref:hypothetical protein n=1 Tax=Pseudomonas syringae TaxID=317 RepID=UPI000A1D9E51|nr:hypothetical protein [Pseudomonas syringae]OSN63084.1 hypothetical protein BV349_04632 [Pseudomonas syringae pv. actinidiae]OSN75481.1 hypothetical protein BV351_03658 [Pseudomonas syringae pv. actinidiae]
MLNQNYLNSICYIIITGENSDSSFFNHYNNFLIRNVGVFHKICTLPKSMTELFLTKEEMISSRLGGVSDGYKVRFCLSIEAAHELPYEFKIAFIVDPIDSTKITHACFIPREKNNSEGYDSIQLEDLDIFTIKHKLFRVIRNLPEDKRSYMAELESFLNQAPTGDYIETDCQFERSIYNRAGLDILSSLRVEYSFEDVGLQWDQEKAIEPFELLKFIQMDIAKNVPPRTLLPHVDLVLTDMSSDLSPLVIKEQYTQNYLKNEGHSDPKALIQALNLINRNTLIDGLDSNPMVSQYYQERLLIEAMIALYAAGYATACIKVPLGNGAVFDKLKTVASIDRGANQAKLNKMVMQLVGDLDFILKRHLDVLPKVYTSAIKIISNLPLEWAHHHGLPLMVRHEVSRITISPGMPTAMSLLDGEQIYMTLENLRKIRVISSFEVTDELRHFLAKKIEKVLRSHVDEKVVRSRYLDELGVSLDDEIIEPLELDIQWFHVSSAQEFLQSLSDNDCAITILNMHGGHGLKGTGTFSVGKDEVSIYDMIGKFHASPIVILCSCDTSPVDRNHYSTATAFQLAGAKTVLASALPILGDEASTFVTRLLLRIRLYLPRRLSRDRGLSVRWSSFVAGMVRRSYYSELFRLMVNRYSLSARTESELNFFAGTHVDPLHENWHEDIMKFASHKIGVSVEAIKQLMEDSFAFPECLKYIQMGNPESIILVAENHIPLCG